MRRKLFKDEEVLDPKRVLQEASTEAEYDDDEEWGKEREEVSGGSDARVKGTKATKKRKRRK